MRFPDFIEKLPQVDFPVPGVRAWLLQASQHQVVFVKSEGDLNMPEHSHAAQLEIPLQGEADMSISGKKKVFGPGQPIYVPAGAQEADDWLYRQRTRRKIR